MPELLSFLEGMDEPHILFDRHYRILAANAAYRRQFSPERSVLGRTCVEVSHHFDKPCDQAGESCPLARAQASGQRERVLYLHHTPHGEEYVNIELSPLQDARGEQAFFVAKNGAAAHGRPGAGHTGTDRPRPGLSAHAGAGGTRVAVSGHRATAGQIGHRQRVGDAQCTRPATGRSGELAVRLGISERSLYRKINALGDGLACGN